MYPDPYEPTAETYVRAFRRGSKLLALAVVIGAGVGVAVGVSTSDSGVRSEGELPAADDAVYAAQFGVPSTVLDILTPEEHAQVMERNLELLVPDLPDTVGVKFTGVSAPSLVKIVVTAPSGVDADRWANVLATAYQATRREELGVRIDSSVTYQEEVLAGYTDRTAEIDAALGTSTLGAAEVAALQNERIQLLVNRVVSQNQLIGLESLRGVATGGFAPLVITDSNVSQKASPVVSLVIGALLGVATAATFLIARTLVDRQVRTRQDLEQWGRGEVLGFVPATSGSERVSGHVAVASALLHRLSDHARSVQFVSVTVQSDLAQTVSAVAAAMGSLGRAAHVGGPPIAGTSSDSLSLVVTDEPLSVGAAAVGTGVTTDGTVLVVSWGRVSDRALNAAAAVLHAAGVPIIGQVMVDVPRRELEWTAGGSGRQSSDGR